MSYFNRLSGGPENGPAHLLDASIDWGQDLRELGRWCRDHPEVGTVFTHLHAPIDGWVAGIRGTAAPHDIRRDGDVDSGPMPGWYAISVHHLFGPDKRYAYLNDFERVHRIGYSIYIYHISRTAANNWRQRHNQPLSTDQ
jgi:hypothetical protein